MTFIHIRDAADLAAVDAKSWVASGTQQALRAFDAGEQTTVGFAQAIHVELQALARGTEGELDQGLAMRACHLLGMTIAHAIVDGVNQSEAADDAFLEESLDDLVATVQAMPRDADWRAGLPQTVRRLLGDAARLSVEEVADGEHFGDLLLAAAMLVVACAA